MTWKKWDESLWYNMNTGHTLKYICQTERDTIRTITIKTIVFLNLPEDKYLQRDFDTEAEALAFIEEFIK